MAITKTKSPKSPDKPRQGRAADVKADNLDAAKPQKLGPNVKKLISYKTSLDAIPPGGGVNDGIKFLCNRELVIKTIRNADEWVKSAITIIRKAADPNPFKTADDETIAAEILRRIEERRANLKPAPKRPPKGTNPVGRPPKYKTPQELQAKIDEYFRNCDEGKIVTRLNKRLEVVTYTQRIPYLLCDLAYHLGFADRHAISDYKGRSDEFNTVISRARTKCEGDLARGSIQGEYDAKSTGLVLSATHGYSVKTQIDLGSKMEDALRALDDKAQSGGKS
jgi:hypothetical protein